MLPTSKMTQILCTSNGCCDRHEWCRFWSLIGECKKNPDWMTVNCQSACNTCFEPPPRSEHSCIKLHFFFNFYILL